MHQTVRDFLISAESGFFINYRTAHEKIATICLKLMESRDRLRRTSKKSKAVISGRTVPSILLQYASSNFSFHLLHSHSISEGTLSRLVDFVSSKTLVWIEQIARRGRLNVILQTIKNLKPYLLRQLEISPPFNQNYQAIQAWIEDLTHIASIFGQTLVDSPESIYAFIPSLCPSSTLIHNNFASGCQQKVIFPSNKSWDDRLTSINFQSSAKCIASSIHHIAVGLIDGTIRIFNSSTFEEVSILRHGAPVRHLAFGNVTNTLVSSSPKAISVWSPKQELVWTAEIPGVALSACFSVDDTKIFVALKNDVRHVVLIFATESGIQLDPLALPEESSSSGSESDSDEQLGKKITRFCPEVISFSPTLGFAAVTWRSSHLTIYSLDADGSLERFCDIHKAGSEDVTRAPQVLAARSV